MGDGGNNSFTISHLNGRIARTIKQLLVPTLNFYLHYVIGWPQHVVEGLTDECKLGRSMIQESCRATRIISSCL